MKNTTINSIPQHIAIILDGNGRWAKKRGLPRKVGHWNGAMNLSRIASYANELGVKYMTVYAFSTENWKRPLDEVEYLMTAPVTFYGDYREKIMNSSIKIRFIGRRDRFPKEFLELVEKVEKDTENHSGMELIVAADYGSRDEIVHAFKEIGKRIKTFEYNVDEIDDNLIESFLYTKGVPDPDLMIRTSGEKRLSNFLLWQLSYSEFYFSKKNWPSFSKRELLRAIKSYQKRNRRYGGLRG